ncbi:aspartate-alanine antiporter-like transporter [Fusibacter bizertensis]
MRDLIFEPYFIIALCVVVGHYVGQLGSRHFKLGSSATLFIGLALSFFIGKAGYTELKMPDSLFTVSLIGFISSVGLIASKKIKEIIKSYGMRFMWLAFVITGTGALSTVLTVNLIQKFKYEAIGTYVGALTSSPGLATALEITKKVSVDASAKVGLGYALAYIPGVLIVVLFAQLMGHSNVSKLTKAHCIKTQEIEERFDIVNYFIVILLGVALGGIEINLGKTFSFSLGVTGGTLISALVLGSSFKLFRFNEKVLVAIREIGLNTFLAIVGLNYGHAAIATIKVAGPILLVIGLMTAVVCILVGYLVGKFIFKFSNELLVGSICGGMTSTPGLASALEGFEGEALVAGYGATYPFALLGMIVFTNIMI